MKMVNDTENVSHGSSIDIVAMCAIKKENKTI